ncbi:outer membrane transport energization protein ExbD [Flavobacterium swingsii]|uniref:Outer membrane transport energization protein ExbD n=1 Tax=Flavobacterium swingsii TaxID=498292 RepID=A0A1I0XU28_9FLAO|nr:biopolymer transporter ExbD [Flavobacterium swingsii]SFB04414.1 outer membrane transport energization protein ExbD [Flavobacterium swingsii]
MAKAKSQKKAAAIDMTAMCDVAFLLLTFFILTATAKQPEPLPVDTPSSTVQTKLPEKDLAMLTVGNGKVFFGVTGKDVRKRTLELMGTKYGMTFTPEEMKKFSQMDAFGVPMSQLKSLIAKSSAERNQKNLQSGIPKDSLDNQLKEWIYNARLATNEIAGVQLKVAIKGDAKQEYPQIKKVMDILQDQKINQFNLVTGLRGEDF